MLDLLDVRRAAEGKRARYRRNRQRSTGDEEHAVLDLGVLGSVRDVAPGVDAGESIAREARADAASEALELEVEDLAELEWRGDRERAVPEVRLWREKLDANAILGHCPERERGLERCNASACDEDMRLVAATRWHGASVAGARGRDIG